LTVDGGELVSAISRRHYALRNGVPILCSDPDRHSQYLTENDGAMDAEYRQAGRGRLLAVISEKLLGHDFRTRASINAYHAIFEGLSDDAVCLAVGGGPLRHDPRLVNVNISDYQNVDVVADAYELPYADGSVAAVFCEAVLEHLEFPEKAITEMHRVLRPGGKVFAATPFLQWYHGYPNHFQNFTLTGHVRLFERAGFSVTRQGTCVGPGFAISMLGICYCRLYMNKVARILFLPVALVFAAVLRRLDQYVNLKHTSHVLASTTYLLAEK
jgi:SAM-dependent methyltransferase